MNIFLISKLLPKKKKGKSTLRGLYKFLLFIFYFNTPDMSVMQRRQFQVDLRMRCNQQQNIEYIKEVANLLTSSIISRPSACSVVLYFCEFLSTCLHLKKKINSNISILSVRKIDIDKEERNIRKYMIYGISCKLIIIGFMLLYINSSYIISILLLF